MKKAILAACGLCLVAASVVQVQLVAREPAAEDKAAEVQRRNKSDGPTVSPYLQVLQRRNGVVGAAADEPAAGPVVDKPAEKAEAPTADLSASQKMLDAARGAYEANTAAFEAETVPLQSVYDWSLRWMEAAQNVAKNQEQKIAAAKEHLERMRNVKRKITLLYQAGSRGGEAKDMRAANYYVAQAERRYAEIEGVPEGEAAKTETSAKLARELQLVDLRIKLAELDGQIRQAQAALDSAVRVAQSVDKVQPGVVAAFEKRRLHAEVEKWKLQLETLTRQRELHQQKLQLLIASGAGSSNTFEKSPDQAPKASAGKADVGGTKDDKPLARYDGKDFDAWADELRNDLSPERRAEAIRAMAAFGAHGMGRQASELIVSAMRDNPAGPTEKTPEGEMAEAAYNAFQRIPARDSFPALVRALNSDAKNQRLFAIGILPGVSASREETTKLLTPMLKDPQAVVRQAVAMHLLYNDPPPPEVGAALREWLASDNPYEVMFAVQAIIGRDQLESGRRRPSAEQLLVRLMPDLLDLLHRDEPIDSMALKALENLDIHAIPALEEAAKSDNQSTRADAKSLLERLRKKFHPSK